MDSSDLLLVILGAPIAIYFGSILGIKYQHFAWRNQWVNGKPPPYNLDVPWQKKSWMP